jgi:hypothetical protein
MHIGVKTALRILDSLVHPIYGCEITNMTGITKGMRNNKYCLMMKEKQKGVTSLGNIDNSK